MYRFSSVFYLTRRQKGCADAEEYRNLFSYPHRCGSSQSTGTTHSDPDKFSLQSGVGTIL